MAKRVTEADSKDKWNFYFPKLLKTEMCYKLLEMNLQGLQSALLRALVRLFVEGKIKDSDLLPLIKAETYITPNNKISKL